MEDKVSIILFDEEEVTKTLVESYLKDITFPYQFIYFPEFDTGLIPSDNSKKIIIVNINKSLAKNIEILEKIGHNIYNRLIVISYNKSTDLQVKTLRVGAKDFLFKPIIKSEFLNALQKIYYREINIEDKKMASKVYSVISLMKGVGKTFFALNLAEQLAKISKERVLLVDFNNNLTDIFQILQMTNVHYSTIQYVNEITEKNASQMFSKLEKFGNVPLYILGTGMFSNNSLKLDEVKISIFFNIAKKYFRYIIVDNDSSMGELDQIIINNTDYIYLVMEPSLSMAEYTENRAFNMKIKNKIIRVILNKYNAQKDSAILSQIEKVLGREIFAKIPKNYISANKAFDKGVSINQINPELDIAKAYFKLAQSTIDSDK